MHLWKIRAFSCIMWRRFLVGTGVGEGPGSWMSCTVRFTSAPGSIVWADPCQHHLVESLCCRETNMGVCEGAGGKSAIIYLLIIHACLYDRGHTQTGKILKSDKDAVGKKHLKSHPLGSTTVTIILAYFLLVPNIYIPILDRHTLPWLLKASWLLPIPTTL